MNNKQNDEGLVQDATTFIGNTLDKFGITNMIRDIIRNFRGGEENEEEKVGYIFYPFFCGVLISKY